MLQKTFIAILSLFICIQINAQQFITLTPAAQKWVDSVFITLTPQEKIAQLMIIRAHSNLGADHVEQVTNYIKKYNVGGLCFFQGGPVRQANLTNYYQQITKTPLLIAIDGEWGVGMRLDSVTALPKQMMLGAVQDETLIYKYGQTVAAQCKRLGIHINYAPVADINNNAANPVINDRSFGEDKSTVTRYAIAYMKGLQDAGIMACAKHFPGHGDVSVDSHYDLPVINKTKAQLDSVELYPFKAMIQAGVASVMVAHLYIPAIDTTANRATSLSPNNINGVLRNELGFKGLVFTDALEMEGVKKYYPSGEASLQSIIAGNDMLCLPGDIPGSIEKILLTIQQGKITQAVIDDKVKKILLAKYHAGLHTQQIIDTHNLTADLNSNTNALRTQISKEAVTIVRLNNKAIIATKQSKKVAFVGIGLEQLNSFAAEIKEAYKAKIFLLDYKDSLSLGSLKKQLRKYKTVIVGVHQYNRKPANNFGLSNNAIELINHLGTKNNTVVFAFGNPYAMAYFSAVQNLVACYEDDKITQLIAAGILQGNYTAKGKLPVSINEALPVKTGL